MPHPIAWSPEADATIIRMRAAGASWDAICGAIGLTRWTVIERGRRIGARFIIAAAVAAGDGADLSREPLPPGHPDTWGAITVGTCLAGAAYPHPVFA